MKTKIIDHAICSYCEKEIELVDSSQYGRNKPCPHCGRKLDIFPDLDSFIETPWGTFGVHWGSNRWELAKSFMKGLF